MNRGDAVGAMRADDGQIRHPNLALGAFLHETYALSPSFIAGKARSHFIKQTAVDLEDDLQMTRQHHLEPLDRPFLQSFGE